MSPDTSILEIVRQSGGLQKFILGEHVKRFEDRLKIRFGAGHTIAVASGAGAIAVILMATNIGPGDEIIVPAFGCASAAGEAVRTGATPVFVDVESQTMVMDPTAIEEKINSRTRALIPTHLFSCMADMPAIMTIARKHSLLVIENAGALHGAELGGIFAGLWGDIGVYSFSPSDVIGACGEAGMIVTNRDDLAMQCRLIRNHGQEEGARFIHKRIGINCRMDEIQAMLLDQTLDNLETILAQRSRIAELYRCLMAPLEGTIVLPPPGTEGRSYHVFAVQTPDRNRLCSHLKADGILAQAYYPTILPRQQRFAAYSRSVTEFVNAERASHHNLGLPLYDGMTDEQASNIAKAVLAVSPVLTQLETMHCWTEADEQLLLNLLRTDTVTPMEADRLGNLAHAQQTYAECARRVGFEEIHFASPPARILSEADTPLSVRERDAFFGSGFLGAQPNLVMRLGAGKPDRTLLLNFHMDTVAEAEPVCRRDGAIFGRGVADAKGLGVAALAAVRLALQRRPKLPEKIGILIQSVGGEEGGALGAYGTKHLVREGYLGRLNIVCEPTDFAYFDRTTSAMTARIAVDGEGSSDDEPLQGQNATILLAALTDMLARELSPKVLGFGAKMCVGGIHTGTMHNRVYGSGELLLNFAYPSLEVGLEIEALVGAFFKKAVERFHSEYSQWAIATEAAAAVRSICKLTWIKRRLPVLSNRDPDMEGILSGVGISRHDVHSTSLPFSCDAMWMARPDAFTIVYGPGHLGRNKTHAAGEFMDIADLDTYAQSLCKLILAFADHAR